MPPENFSFAWFELINLNYSILTVSAISSRHHKFELLMVHFQLQLFLLHLLFPSVLTVTHIFLCQSRSRYVSQSFGIVSLPLFLVIALFCFIYIVFLWFISYIWSTKASDTTLSVSCLHTSFMTCRYLLHCLSHSLLQIYSPILFLSIFHLLFLCIIHQVVYFSFFFALKIYVVIFPNYVRLSLVLSADHCYLINVSLCPLLPPLCLFLLVIRVVNEHDVLNVVFYSC